MDVNYIGFIRNRLLRIAPLFIFWMLFYFHSNDIDPIKLFIAIFSLLNNKTIPGNGWTVIVEFQFYLLFPFLLIFFRHYGLRYLIGLIFFSLFFKWSDWYIFGTVHDLSYSTIFGRIDQFLAGILFCELSARYKFIFRQRLLFFLVIILWILFFHIFDYAGGYFDNTGGYPSSSFAWVFWPGMEGLFYGLITAFYINVDISIPTSIDKLFAWLGTLSYSLYLNQNFAILISQKLLNMLDLKITGIESALSLGLLITLPILILMSLMTYNLIEKPFLLLRKPYLKPLT